MKNMFSGCTELKYLDLSSFNTKNVTNMSGRFGEFNDTFFNIDKFNKIIWLKIFHAVLADVKI